MSNVPRKTNFCRRCGSLLEPSVLDGMEGYCPRCAVALAEEHVPAEVPPPLHRRILKSRGFRIFQWVLLLVCLAVTLTRIPLVLDSFSDPRPLRKGSFATDVKTDGCIQNLWQAGRLLQEERLPGQELVCPATGRPYAIRKDGGQTIVQCPNPEKHGLRELRLSSSVMIPEVIP